MSTRTSRSAVCLAASMLLVVLVGACAVRSGEPSTTDEAATVAPTTTTIPPPTADERAWLDAIPALTAKVDKSMAAVTNLSAAAMARLGKSLQSCTRDLMKGGSPSDRLQPAYALVTKACKEYDKGAVCFATAAKIGIAYVGTPEEKIQTKAINCGLAAPATGSVLLVDAETKGAKIIGEDS